MEQILIFASAHADSCGITIVVDMIMIISLSLTCIVVIEPCFSAFIYTNIIIMIIRINIMANSNLY